VDIVTFISGTATYLKLYHTVQVIFGYFITIFLHIVPLTLYFFLFSIIPIDSH